MRITIIDQYYSGFLDHHYKQHNGLVNCAYKNQRDSLLSTCFGTADFYSRHLRELGHDAIDIIANCAPLQRQWARENALEFNRFATEVSVRWQRLPLFGKWLARAKGLLFILLEQIREEKPDVLYVQDLSAIPPEALSSLKGRVALIVGQIACPLPPDGYLKPYDLILSSFPHYVKRLRAQGIASEYLRIAFEPLVLQRMGDQEKRYTCTFVGGISRIHRKGNELLEHLARRVDMDFFGYGVDMLPKSSPVRQKHHGEAWGLDMYRVLAQSYITVNRHIDVAENYANNMRLFEATGCGAMLITDAKDNLNELFEVGKEVVVYSSPEEAAELIEYYASHPKERDAIARAGQQHTLREHTYRQRMEELVAMLQRYLPEKGRG